MAQDNRNTAIVDAEDLPELTPKQLAFVQGLLEGKTGADAYRGAYDCEGSGAHTIWTEATKLRSNPAVAMWLAAARRAALGNGVLTVGGHLRELERLREIAVRAGNLNAAVAAEQLRGKAAGLYVERSEVMHYDPATVLEQIAKIDGDAARSLARRFGLPVPLALAQQTTEPVEDAQVIEASTIQ